MSNLQLRLLSAAVLIPVVFGAMILGGMAFAVFVLLAFVLSMHEWLTLSLKTQRKVSLTLFGLIYLPICFYEFYYLRTGFADGLYLVLTMLVVVWSSDTGAYIVGRKFGKHKMTPTISPSKSWEGLAGSMFFSGSAFYLMVMLAPHMATILPNNISPEIDQYLPVFSIGAVLGYIGQAGDLIESLLKRRAGAKDSGNLIPGHGGVLDRVDSLLLVAPFFVLIAIYVL